MTICQFLIMSASVASEALGFVFQLLHFNCSKLISWICAHHQKFVERESKQIEELADDDYEIAMEQLC